MRCATTARIDGHDDVTFDDVYSGQTALISAAGAVANPLTALLNTDIAAVDVEAVEIAVRSAEAPRTAVLERVWLDSARIRPGDTVRLNILARGYRGEDLVETVSIDIPSNVSGSLQVLVSDAAGTERQRTDAGGRGPREPRTSLSNSSSR